MKKLSLLIAVCILFIAPLLCPALAAAQTEGLSVPIEQMPDIDLGFVIDDPSAETATADETTAAADQAGDLAGDSGGAPRGVLAGAVVIVVTFGGVGVYYFGYKKR